MFFSFSQSEIMLQKMCSEKKKTVRKLLIFNLFLALFLCFGLAACGQKSNSETTSDNQTSTHTGTTDKKPYSFYTDSVEYWKDVVEKDQKNFFKIEDRILNTAFNDLYYFNVNILKRAEFTIMIKEYELYSNAEIFTNYLLLKEHILNGFIKMYQSNNYMSSFLEDATNYCENKPDNFSSLAKDKSLEIYQKFIAQKINVGEYEEFKDKYNDLKIITNLSCDVLSDFNQYYKNYNKQYEEVKASSVFYQLQDSMYCHEQAESDYDCLSYLYNLTSNRKAILFKEDHDAYNVNLALESKNNLWHQLLVSQIAKYFSDEEISEFINLEKNIKSNLKDFLDYSVRLLQYEEYVFTRYSIASSYKPVLRLNQVDANAPAVVVQLNDDGLAELEKLDIPENNKTLARKIIRNVQQAYDYRFLDKITRAYLSEARDKLYMNLRDIYYYLFDKNILNK